jgi:HEAT repeat protein
MNHISFQAIIPLHTNISSIGNHHLLIHPALFSLLLVFVYSLILSPTPTSMPPVAPSPDANLGAIATITAAIIAALIAGLFVIYQVRQNKKLADENERIQREKDCIDTLLYRWDTSRDIRRRRRFQIEHKQQLLPEIAWHFHLQGRRYFPEDELLELIADFLPTVGRLSEENKAILGEIEEENGLLKEQAHSWHGFLHLTLQEYLVAQHLVGMPDGLDQLLKHCGDPWWEEVMLLYAGSVPDASPLLYALLKQEKQQWFWKDIFHASLLWAGQCLTAKPRLVQRALRDEILAHFFALLKKKDLYALTCEQVIKTLLQIEGYDARGKVLWLLKDKQTASKFRRDVAGALGQLGERTGVPELLAVLKDKRDNSDVRQDVAGALGQLGERTVIPELLAVLKDKQDKPKIRGDVAEALGKIRERTVIPELLAVLKDKQDNPNARMSVARALGQIGERTVIPELLTVLKDKQEDINVRGSAGWALGKLGERTMARELLAMLKDKREDSYVRQFVAQALGQLGERTVAPELLAMLKDKREDSYVRQLVAQALGQLGERTVIPELLAMFKDKREDSYVRRLVAEALGQLGERAIARELLAMLKDKQEDSYVRQLVAQTLGQLGERTVIPELQAILKDEQDNKIVRQRVAHALITLGQHEIVLPYLYLVINDETRFSRSGPSSELIWNIASLRAFTKLLKQGFTGDAIHRTLWAASQREKVRILMFKCGPIKLVRVVKC